EARYVKSAEEIEFLRKAVGVAEAAAGTMRTMAKDGVFEPAIMGQMYTSMLSAGGSMPAMLGWFSGPFGREILRLEQATHRKLRNGDYFAVEIEGRWGGYIGQIDRSMTIGAVPDWAQEACRMAGECLSTVIDRVAPSVTFGELRTAMEKAGSGKLRTGL